jgi:hypothetical protein
VLGIALLVSVLGTGSDVAGLLDGHRRGWTLVAVFAIVSALISMWQPQSRTRRVVAVERPVELPARV